MIINEDKEQEIQRFYDLLIFIQTDPDKGLEIFYKQYGKFVDSVAKIYRRSTITEKEISQEVLLGIWRASKRPKRIENIKGWIYTIAINSAKSALRKRKFSSLSEDTVAVKDGIQDFIEIDTFNYLIRNLSLKEKEIIIQKVLLKATLREIAKTMRKPIGSISSIYYRAQEKIRADLEKSKQNEII